MKGYIVKLVRDRIGERVGPARGFHYETLDYGKGQQAMHVKLLREKLGEEVVEYLVDPSVDELADVLQAIHDLALIDLDVDFGTIDLVRRVKFNERGGFTCGTIMVATDEGYEGEPRPEWGES